MRNLSDPQEEIKKGFAMRPKKILPGYAAVLLVLLVVLILLPSARQAVADTTKAKIAPGLAKQLSAAGPDEAVTAIVKMATKPNLDRIRGNRRQVFTELRRNSRASQSQLINFLDAPSVKRKVQKVRPFWLDNVVLVTAPKDVIETIAARPDVEEVFENFTITLPPMPRLDKGTPWFSPLQTQTQLWDSMKKIGVKQVWTTYGFTGTGVVCGGLDTGVDITHPDIAGKMKTNNPGDPTYPGGWAEFDANGNIIAGSTPHDTDGHGTHTTGTMLGGNASGYDIGAAPGAKLIHGLVLPGGSGSFAQVAGGMEWIVDPDDNPLTDDGADVVNMSLGATGTYPQMIAPTDNMVAANVFPSFSIGNSGPGSSTTGSPGNVPSAFGVGATDSNNVIASFSSRGPVTWNNPPYVGTWTKPDISAPGVRIYSSVPGGTWQWHGDGWDWSGTSMSAPHVSGSVALIRQANPSLTVDQIKQILAQTSLDLGNSGMDNDYGWGRINTFSAVTAAVAGMGTLAGTITSSGGGPVEDALVLIVDTGQRVYSDEFGHYSLSVVGGTHTVEVSHFGYQTYTTTVSVVADQTTGLDVVLSQLPSGTIAGFVTDAETGAGISANITVKLAGNPVAWTSTDPLTGAYSILVCVGTYDLVFSPPFPYPLTIRTNVQVFQDVTTTLNVTMNAAQILIVDDDGGKGYHTYFEQAVAAAGRSYLTVTTTPTAAEMDLFESVVWLTGDDYTTTITAANETEIAAYLNGGGRLFISGQDIGYDINTSPFYANYLHATYKQDNVGLGGVLGSPENPVGIGFAFNIKGGDGANNQAYPSEIDPIAPAQRAFVYDPTVPKSAAAGYSGVGKEQLQTNGIISSGTAGLTFDNDIYKLVYLAFGFEAIANATTRGMVMDRVLDWLQGYPEIAHTPLGDTEDTEHPYRVAAIITSDYFPLDPSTFAVIYDTGGPETSVPMTATGVPNEYAGLIPAQASDSQVNYYITASDVEGHASTHPVGAPLNKHSFMVAGDAEDPVVEHRRRYDTNDLVGPYGISAVVTDNIGVEAVYLMYARNGGLFHRVKMLLQEDNRYYGAIPGPSVVGDYYDYYLLAMDDSYSGNVTRMPATGSYHFEIVEYFSWDFEEYDGEFVPTGGVWEWGAPTSGPGNAHSGAKLWATVLAGDYPNNANAKLDAPPIALSASKPYAMLTFWNWYYMETNYDGGNVKVSTDGGETWNVLTPFDGYDGTATSGNKGIPGEPCFTGYNNNFWHQELFDLSPYAGQEVTVRYHFGSDGSVYKAGWYLDDVMIRSTSTDDVPPIISGTQVPPSTFDTVGPYQVSTYVRDFLSTVGAVSTFYSVNGGASWSEIAMSPGSPANQWVCAIPGQPAGTRIKMYIKARDTASPSNASTDPAGAPGAAYEFAILPSAPTLVVIGSTSVASLDMYRQALEANGHAADYWDRVAQGWLTLDKLSLYKTIILDEPSGLSTQQMTDLSNYLNSGMLGSRKQIFLLGRDLGYSSTTRPWLEQYTRAAYVQDDPAYRQISGEPGEPIGAGETFVISGSYPDEVQRSTSYPGGEIIYRFTGTGTSLERGEVAGAYEKEGKEWDGVMPHIPKSLDAAAAMKYSCDKYRSVYFTFNLGYVLEPERRAGIVHRALGWLSAPEIVHAPLRDTEDTDNAYPVIARIYSETLDLSRIRLTYDVGAGPVIVAMTPTANPNEYSAAIPPQEYGTTVYYYVSAANLDGNMSYHPGGAPAVQHRFLVSPDMTPPVIVHVPLSNTADLDGPYGVSATITDNVGVDPSNVFVVYNKNGGGNTTLPMASLGGDVYAASIPGPSVLGDVYNYYILARDIAAVPNTARDPIVGVHSFEAVDYYAWDFELSNGGFSTTGPDWEWGDPTTGPMDAHSGVNVWATKLSANYSVSSNSKLNSPVIKVPSSLPYTMLSFWQWYYMEKDYDGGNVKISTDNGSTWTTLTPDIGYNGTAKSTNAGIPNEPCFTGTTSAFWHKASFNLTPYKGQNVMIRLHFGSDASVQYAGWYVDDVRIEGALDTQGPVITSTKVPSSTFDTVGPYSVTTTVVDALSGVGTVTLYYSTNAGATWTPVTMTPTATPSQYKGDIPGQPSRTRIKLYIEASDNASNVSKDPAGAPANAYEFGIMPSGDYIVMFAGAAHTPPDTFRVAFSAIGKTADMWDMDDSGLPTIAILRSYVGVVIDHSSYFSTALQTLLTNLLDTPGGARKQIFMLGRDLQYYSAARTWMESHTGTVYVKDDPGWRQIRGLPGDPIGAGEIFTIAGSYPDEVKKSTTYPGAQIVYKYSGLGAALDRFATEPELKEFYEKEGKEYDSKLWPMAPSGPDSIAGASFVKTTYVSVYFAFNFNYIKEGSRRAAILGRTLNWLATAAGSQREQAASPRAPAIPIPDKLALLQNYPNPFSPFTTIQIAIPAGFKAPVSVRIFDVRGKLVKTLFQGTKEPGFHSFDWNGRNEFGQSVSSGIYFCRFSAGANVMTRKMMLLR
ncbi:MAG: S8 family serine peptidase [Candidatus Eisenbacteria bacterium]|nr:S8 family serine peptidase [Candidatus Eisenbacteria bacterium]